MGKSTRERFLEKLGIRLEPQDPVPLEENYFLVLGLDETLSPQETVAKIQVAVLSRQRQIKNYGHIDTTVSGEFGHLLSKAAAALGSPSQVQQHRDQLLQARLKAFVENEAQPLKDGGVEHASATRILVKKAPAFGFPRDRLSWAVSEATRKLWRNDPVPPHPRSDPNELTKPDPGSVPRKLWYVYAAPLLLMWCVPGLAVLLAVVGTVAGGFVAYRRQSRQYVLWAGGCAACLGLALLPVVFTGPKGGPGPDPGGVQPGKPLQGNPWSLPADFRIDNGNPDGVWSYGWTDTSFAKFTPFTNRGSVPTFVNCPAWFGWDTDGTPLVWLNTSRMTRGGIPPGQVSLHPGRGHEPAVVRWTAPAGTSGQANVSGEFYAGDTGRPRVSVRHKGAQVWSVLDAGKFQLSLAVSPGETIDFAVSEGFGSASTGLEVRIQLKPAANETFAEYVNRSTFENEYVSIFEMDIQGTRVVGGRSVARTDPGPDSWGRIVDGQVEGDKISFRWTWKGQTGTGVLERLPDGGIRGTNPASRESHILRRTRDKEPKVGLASGESNVQGESGDRPADNNHERNLPPPYEPRATGKVTKISGGVIAIDLGRRDKIATGQVVRVKLLNSPIFDPSDANRVLGYDEVDVRVLRTAEETCEATVVKKDATLPQPGDVVRLGAAP